MDKLEQRKNELIARVQSLCAHCKEGRTHMCPVTRVVSQIRGLRGVPIIVNDSLHHVMFSL